MTTEIGPVKPPPEIEAYNLMTAPASKVPCCLHFTFPDRQTSVLYLKSVNGIDIGTLRNDRKRESLRAFGDLGDLEIREFPLDSLLGLTRILSIVIEAENEKKKPTNIRKLRRIVQGLLRDNKDF